jgi:hypothetical protein
MDIAELIDIALADVDERRVEMMALEPAEVPRRVVGALAGLLSEVTGILVASGPAERIRATGSWEDDSYRISISAPIGILGDGVTVLNRLLEQPVLATGLASAARLAADHDLTIRLDAFGYGPAFQVTLPAHVVGRAASNELPLMAEEPSTEFIPHEMERRDLVPADSAREDSEAFLESVFGVLRNPWHEPLRPEPAVLQVRVPGESFSMTDDDSPSTSPAEAAVDIRSALSAFDQGRRAAEIASDSVEAPI